MNRVLYICTAVLALAMVGSAIWLGTRLTEVTLQVSQLESELISIRVWTQSISGHVGLMRYTCCDGTTAAMKVTIVR